MVPLTSRAAVGESILRSYMYKHIYIYVYICIYIYCVCACVYPHYTFIHSLLWAKASSDPIVHHASIHIHI
jgi:hypothetical protein